MAEIPVLGEFAMTPAIWGGGGARVGVPEGLVVGVGASGIAACAPIGPSGGAGRAAASVR